MPSNTHGTRGRCNRLLVPCSEQGPAWEHRPLIGRVPAACPEEGPRVIGFTRLCWSGRHVPHRHASLSAQDDSSALRVCGVTPIQAPARATAALLASLDARAGATPVTDHEVGAGGSDAWRWRNLGSYGNGAAWASQSLC